MEKGKRKRSAKITAGQYQIYLETLQSNEALRTNKFNAKNPDVLDESWTSLALKLNAAGGPVKTVQEWKERFSDWKCNVRKKARKIALSEIKTGGGPPADIPLTAMENSLLDLTGRAVISGIDVPELGLDDNPLPENVPTTSSQQVTPPTKKKSIAPWTSSVPENVGALIQQPQSTIKKKQDATNTTSDPENVQSPSTPSQTPRTKKKHQTRVPLTTSVRDLVMNESKSNNVLEEINTSLKTLIKLKKRELMISELKLQMKHPEIEFEMIVDSD